MLLTYKYIVVSMYVENGRMLREYNAQQRGVWQICLNRIGFPFKFLLLNGHVTDTCIIFPSALAASLPLSIPISLFLVEGLNLPNYMLQADTTYFPGYFTGS